MTGYYYDRRVDETQSGVADAVFAAMIQLFTPFPYAEHEKIFKKSMYFLIDRELFAYTDVISLSFFTLDGDYLPEIDPEQAAIYRFAVAYFLHCMVNRKLSSCPSELHELSGRDPDIYLMDELFKAANTCCSYHAVQDWLIGIPCITEGGRYRRNAFLKVKAETKARVFRAARSCRFTLRDRSGHFEYSWVGARRSSESICIEIEIKYPLEEYATYEDMVKGLLQNWGGRIFESFREEILEEYKKGLDQKEKEKLAKMRAVRGSDVDINDIIFKVSENFYWKLLGLKRRNTILSQRFASDLELMLYTLSVGENRETYEQLRRLRNKAYGADGESAGGGEMKVLKKTLSNYLNLGPDRYMRALEQMKDLFRAGIPSDALWVRHDKVSIPNMPRMVLIIIAFDRYSSGLEDIRRLNDDKKDELTAIFRDAFIKTEVTKLALITEKEIRILLENDRTLGAKKEDLEDLVGHMRAAGKSW